MQKSGVQITLSWPTNVINITNYISLSPVNSKDPPTLAPRRNYLKSSSTIASTTTMRYEATYNSTDSLFLQLQIFTQHHHLCCCHWHCLLHQYYYIEWIYPSTWIQLIHINNTTDFYHSNWILPNFLSCSTALVHKCCCPLIVNILMSSIFCHYTVFLFFWLLSILISIDISNFCYLS